jgi:hypothetical protein
MDAHALLGRIRRSTRNGFRDCAVFLVTHLYALSRGLRRGGNMQALVRADVAQERIETCSQLVPGAVRQQFVECDIPGRARYP